MPIPTDNFFNIRRLNRVFAVSAVLMLFSFIWAVYQDWDKGWKRPQRDARTWEAAMVEQRLRHEQTPERRAAMADVERRIAEAQQRLLDHDQQYNALVRRIEAGEGEVARVTAEYNNVRSVASVLEARLQDARNRDDEVAIADLTKQLATPAAEAARDAAQLSKLSLEIDQAKRELAEKQKGLAALRSQRLAVSAELDALRKQAATLVPRSGGARWAARLRAAPLLQFLNPSERIQQVVLPDVRTDVSFAQVDTTDRCITCHVHADDRRFSAENVVAFLEAEVAAARQYRYEPQTSPTRKATDPTADRPGATALPEFWHAWARQLLSADALKKTASKTKAIAAGAPPAAGDDAAFVAAIQALYRTDPADEKFAAARGSALAYPAQLRTLLRGELPAETFKQIEERYRFALVDEVNVVRRRNGYEALDPSPVQLAHPRLDLYADPDSPHRKDLVGCTSCHDGSGQETDFVLAAHTPREVWVDAITGEPVLTGQLTAAQNDENRMTNGGSHSPSDIRHSSLSSPPPRSTEREAVAYLDPVSGRTGQAISQAAYWKRQYEAASGTSFQSVREMWDWPMRPPRYVQANCARCHNNVYDIAEEAPNLSEGRAMFTRLGCANCHQVDRIPPEEKRPVGTDLRHLPAKLSREFVNAWVWAPKAFRPSTLMPHFFMLENNSGDEELRRTRQEARAITEYLFAAATPLPPKHMTSAKGDAENGKSLFGSVGCQGCHANLNETGEKWITTDLWHKLVESGEAAAALRAKSGKEPTAGQVTAAAKAEAKKRYAAMNYNQRQQYALDNFGVLTSSSAEQARYFDNQPRPIFIHFGPELSGIGDKLTAGRSVEQARAWLIDWLEEPRHYSMSTAMPRLRLAEQEAADLAEYLLAQHRTTGAPDGADKSQWDAWRPELFPVDGKKVAELVAFFLRSQYAPEMADRKAADEAEMTQRATDALSFADAGDGNGGAEARRRARSRAAGQVAGMSLQQKQLVFLGARLVATYGCMQCHNINGMDHAASPCPNLSEWGMKGVDKLDFGYLDALKQQALPPGRTFHVPGLDGRDPASTARVSAALDHRDFTTPLAAIAQEPWPHVERARQAWLEQKLSNPRIYDRGNTLKDPARKIGRDGKPVLDAAGNPTYEVLAGAELRGRPYDKYKMPQFFLNERQIHALVTFVLSNREPLVSDRLLQQSNNETARRIARGRQVVEQLNCTSCHQVELNFPQVRQYTPSADWATKAPPSLRGEGNKVQFEWLFNFLRRVEPIRPATLEIRMPSFDLSDDQATALAAYFNAASIHESKQGSFALRKLAEPISAYIADQRRAATQPTTDPAAVWPGDRWYAVFPEQAATLRAWAVQRELMRDAQFDPAKCDGDELAHNYRELLFKAQFVQRLFDAPYPMTASGMPDTHAPGAPARLKEGGAFFLDLKCLSCHVMGDPAAAGALKNPTAPNLSLVASRLQRRWVAAWVQEPPVIQPGTAMPAFFTGLPTFAASGQPWPLAQNGTPEDTQKMMARYHTRTPQDQINLLLDYLYDASHRGLTTVQPPDAPPPK